MANPNSTNFEEALLKLTAGWTGRTIGTDIFLGALPEKMLESTAAILDNEIPNTENDDGLRRYSARYIGKFAARETARLEIDKIKENLVKYSEDVVIDGGATVKLHQVRLRGGEGLYETKDDGQECWNCVLNLICTFNPQT